MTFWQKIKMGLARYMQGRYGADHLGQFTLFAGLACTLLAMFLGIGLLSTVGLALYAWSLFRMLSRNKEKRAMENRRYLAWSGNWKIKYRQFMLRQKNRKQYKYFKCPKCRALLRLTRGCGKVHITCAKCGHPFDQEA